MILGGGLRVENNYLDGISISQLDDMVVSSSAVFTYGHAGNYYDNKIYYKANYQSADLGLQSFNVSTGSWLSLTSTNIASTIYGLEVSGSNLYTVSASKSGATTRIDVVPYTPLNDTWGTKQTFYHNYNQDTRTCMSGSLMYILYEYSNTSDNYTWHLMSYDINTNTNSSDLNFSASSVGSPTVSLTHWNNVLYYMANSNVHEYNIINNTSTIIGRTDSDMGRAIYYNDYIYYPGYTSAGILVIKKYNIISNTSSLIYTNIPYMMYNSVIDNNGNFYVYGTKVYGTTEYGGQTYKINNFLS